MFYINIKEKEINISLKDPKAQNSLEKIHKMICGSYIVHLVGYICEKNPEKMIKRLITESRKNVDQLIHDIYLNVPGKYSLVIYSKDRKIIISSSYDMHCLYLYETKDKYNYLITDHITKISDSEINEDNLYARIFSGPNGLQPLTNEIKEIIIPGMWLSLNYHNKHNIIEEGWTIPFEKIASRTDHEKIAHELANEMKVNIKKYTDNNICTTYLNLSGGIDSALMAAAAKSENVNLKYATHFHQYLDNDNYHAIDLANKLEIEINLLPYQATHHYSSRYDNTDWKDLIDDFIFPAHRSNINSSITPGGMSLTLPFIKKDVVQLEGNSYPVSLCIQHSCVYPLLNPIKEFTLNIVQKKRRYQYSESKTHELINSSKNDKYKNFNEKIHPYYNYAFSIIFNKKSLTGNLKSCFERIDDKLLINYYENYLFFIAKKISKDINFREQLRIPNPDILQKLMKLIAFIDGPVRASSSLNIDIPGFSRFNIGLASSISFLLLSVKFDKLLIENSKWHIFRAFEIIAGFSFLKQYRDCLNIHKYDHLISKIKIFLSRRNILKERYSNQINNHNELLKNQSCLQNYFSKINKSESKLMNRFNNTHYSKKLDDIYNGFFLDQDFLHKNVTYEVACNLVTLEVFLDQ